MEDHEQMHLYIAATFKSHFEFYLAFFVAIINIYKLLSFKYIYYRERQQIFCLGISFGHNDLSLEGHLKAVYSSKTVKIYRPVVIHPLASNAIEETLPVIENSETAESS